MFVVGHEHQVIGVLGKARVIVRTLPFRDAAPGIGRHSHGHQLVPGQQLPEQTRKVCVGVPVLGGKVFDVHANAVELIQRHRVPDLLCQGFPIDQRRPAQLPVPMV